MSRSALHKRGFKKITDIAQTLLKLGKLELRVGIVGPEAKQLVEGSTEITLARLAAILEYGTEDGHIPERAFMRGTLVARRADIARLKTAAMKDVLAGKATPEQALERVGIGIVAMIKAAVMAGDGIAPPNAPSTIKRKGSSRPLVDKGTLIAHSLTYRVAKASEPK